MPTEINADLELLIRAAPKAVKGTPTDEQIREQTEFKERVKKFIASQPPSNGFSYKGIVKMINARQLGPSKDKQKAQTSTAKPTKPKKMVRARDHDAPTNFAPVDYICVLNFQATCDNVSPPEPQEIIEFSTLLLSVKTGEVEDKFHYYVKPDVHTSLSPHCTELSGITQETVNGGISLKEALRLHREWLNKHGLVNPDVEEIINPAGEGQMKRFYYVTAGDWDLKTCLQGQLAYHELRVPEPFDSWINIKWPFSKLYGVRGTRINAMLEAIGLEVEGRHHSAIDHCRNIARICARMLEDGWKPASNGGAALIGTPQFWSKQSKIGADIMNVDGHAKTVFLIRHGQSKGQVAKDNARANDESLWDCDLTDLGVRQAVEIPKSLGEANVARIDCVISSPLKRALRTALLGFTDNPITVHYDLGEVGSDIPENSPRPLNEVLSELSVEIGGRSSSVPFDYSTLQPEGWPNPTFRESRATRIQTAFEWMHGRDEQVFAVVCHYNVIKTALRKKAASPENGVPIQCRLFPDGSMTVVQEA